MSENIPKEDARKIFRTRYLIDRDFQLKYAFLLACVAIFVALLIGGVVYYAMQESYQVLASANLMDNAEVRSLVQQWKNFLTYNLLIILCGTIVFLTIFGVLVTHKIVGPIYVLKKRLNDVTAGRYHIPMTLRRSDEFQGLKHQFNTMIEALRLRNTTELKILNDISQKVQNPEAKSALNDFINQKKRNSGD